MDFTREPIIESVITPKEGCTLVVRSSKSSGQEEHFVDAVEVVTFGNAIFFRSRERPKAFLVPVSDYEILEVRETRLLLKNVGVDRAIKIAGGREAPLSAGRDISSPKTEPRLAAPPEKHAAQAAAQPQPQGAQSPEEALSSEAKADLRLDKKRDRRRNHRRRRGKDDEASKAADEEGEGSAQFSLEAGTVALPSPHMTKEEIEASAAAAPVAAMLSSLLSPPPNLISETIARYKDNVLFKGAFFSKEDDSVVEREDEGEERDDENSAGESSTSDAADYSHRNVLHEGLVEHGEEISIPKMSLDYPVYGNDEALRMEEAPSIFENDSAATSETVEVAQEEAVSGNVEASESQEFFPSAKEELFFEVTSEQEQPKALETFEDSKPKPIVSETEGVFSSDDSDRPNEGSLE